MALAAEYGHMCSIMLSFCIHKPKLRAADGKVKLYVMVKIIFRKPNGSLSNSMKRLYWIF